MDPAEALVAAAGVVVAAPDGRPGRGRPDAAVAPVREPPPVLLRAAHPEAGGREQLVERRPVAEHDRHPQRDPSGRRQLAGEERALPVARHVDGEALAELAVVLGLRSVGRVAVDRRGARVQPQPRRSCGAAYGVAERAGRPGPREVDLLAVGVGVAAADAAPGEVDHQVGAVDGRVERRPVVPAHVRPATPDDHDVVPARPQVLRQPWPEEPRRPGQDRACTVHQATLPHPPDSGA